MVRGLGLGITLLASIGKFGIESCNELLREVRGIGLGTDDEESSVLGESCDGEPPSSSCIMLSSPHSFSESVLYLLSNFLKIFDSSSVSTTSCLGDFKDLAMICCVGGVVGGIVWLPLLSFLFSIFLMYSFKFPRWIFGRKSKQKNIECQENSLRKKSMEHYNDDLLMEVFRSCF